MAARKNSRYLKQLDGLRAFSVAAVAWNHWGPYGFPKSQIPWGELGVETFFVISGFLITGILLDNRSETATPFILKQFYIRRFLRIFPLFYATLVIALIWNANSVRETRYWHAGYLSNIYFYLHGWCGQLSHFWSLAVEEQFYLLWPLLMVFLPNRFLLTTIVAAIASAPVFEIGMDSFFPGHFDVTASVLTPSCLDALGIGALMAYGVRKNYPMKRIVVALLLVGLIGCPSCHFFNVSAPIARLAEDCILGWLVFSAAQGFRGPFGWLLECAPLNYLGKISYGLYVFHNFANSMTLHMIMLFRSPPWLMNLYGIPSVRILIFAGLTVGLASYSWHRFEKPINDLKRKFPYPDEKQFPAFSPPQTNIPNPLP